MKNFTLTVLTFFLSVLFANAQLTGITPNQGALGQSLQTTITGNNIFIQTMSPSGNLYEIRLNNGTNVIQIFDLSFFNWNTQVIDPDTVIANFTIPITAVQGVYDLEVTTFDIFNPWNTTNYVLPGSFTVSPHSVSGTFFFDQNQNKQKDPGEPGIHGGKVELISFNHFGFTDYNGDYLIGSLGGQQTLTWVNNTATSNLILYTDSSSYTFNASGNITGKDFGFISSAPDYSIEVKSFYMLPRCNTNQDLSFKVKNLSNVTYDALVWLKLDPLVSFISSPVTPYTISNDTVFWNINGIQPFTEATIIAKFNLPGAGNSITFNAGATSLDGNNVSQLSDTGSKSYSIICAWDPNDKLVTPEGIFAQNYTLMSDTLYYLIRFQNTGNDTAFNVVIRDTLDTNLDLNSLEILGSSHIMYSEIQSNGAMEFTFNNILLPDSNVNEPESHGYIQYRIKAKPGLPDGTPVENTAHIFFDFNPAIVTNTTLNTLVFVLPSSVSNVQNSNSGVTFYPNPFNETATLIFDNPENETHTLIITDLTGKVILSDKLTNGNLFTIKKGKLSKGVYLYSLQNKISNKFISGKFVIE